MSAPAAADFARCRKARRSPSITTSRAASPKPAPSWDCKYAVVTSVNRDDRKDGGAELFALTIRAIRERIPGCKVEVLVPDFQGSHGAMEIVMNAHPDVLNHNIETVPRLYRQVRLGARYERSLDMLAYRQAVCGPPSPPNPV